MDSCDKCGRTRELFHNETTGLALCGDCDLAQDALDEVSKREAERTEAIRFALRKIRDLADGIRPSDLPERTLDTTGTIHNLASLAILSLDALVRDSERGQ